MELSAQDIDSESTLNHVSLVQYFSSQETNLTYFNYIQRQNSPSQFTTLMALRRLTELILLIVYEHWI